MITGVPIGVHEYAQRMTGVGMCTQPWLAMEVFSLPGPYIDEGSHDASCRK